MKKHHLKHIRKEFKQEYDGKSDEDIFSEHLMEYNGEKTKIENRKRTLLKQVLFYRI